MKFSSLLLCFWGLSIMLIGWGLCPKHILAQSPEEPMRFLARYEKIGIVADLDCSGPQFGCLGRLKAFDLNSLVSLPVLSDSLCPMAQYEGLLGGFGSIPSYPIEGVQKGPLLYTWCTGSAAFQVWHIPTRKKIQEIPIQAERSWFEPFYLYRGPVRWASDGKWAALREPRERLVLIDSKGKTLAKTPLPSTIRTIQKGERFAWTVFGRAKPPFHWPVWETWAQIWAYPSLTPVAQWKMPNSDGHLWLFQQFGLRYESCQSPQGDQAESAGSCRSVLASEGLFSVEWVESLTGQKIKKQIYKRVQTYGFEADGWWLSSGKELQIFGITPQTKPLKFRLKAPPEAVYLSKQLVTAFTPKEICFYQRLKNGPAHCLPRLSDTDTSSAWIKQRCKSSTLPPYIQKDCSELEKKHPSEQATKLKIEKAQAIGVYNLETGKQRTVIPIGEDEPWFHVHQGHLLRVNPTPLRPRFSWLNLDTLKTTEINGPDLPIGALAIEKNVMITADPNTLYFWDLDSSQELFKRPFHNCKPEELRFTPQEIVYLCSQAEPGGRDSEGHYRRARHQVWRSTLKKDPQDWEKSFQTEWMETRER